MKCCTVLNNIMRDSWCRSCNKATDREQPLMILEKLLPPQYNHTVCSYETIGDNGFKTALKLKLSSEQEAKKWLEDFQYSSGFTWRTSKTYPNVGRYNKFRVDYMCRTIKKNTSCPATLFMILKRWRENGERKSRSGDPHTKEGLFLHINLRNEHNHVPCAGVTARREVSGETKEKLKKLFEIGHSASSALKTLKSDLQAQGLGKCVNAAAVDRSVCPDLQFCYRLYYKLFKKSYDVAAGGKILQDLQETLDNYNKERGDICARMCKTSDNHLVIAICTPVMRRVHARLRESGEMVFVDSSGNCGHLNHHIFLLLTHSSAGGLPLGVFITTSETQATISAAMELLQTVFPSDGFYGHPEGPLVVVTDDCATLRRALQEAFPEATLLLCVFHLLQAMWRWLWSSSNEVPLQHRTHLLKSFRDLVYAPTPEALMEGYTLLMEDHIALQHPKFVQHLQENYKRREEWAICLQAQLATTGNYISNYVESATRVVKEKVLHRLKSYNVTQLVNFVVTRMEAYYVRHLTDVANNRMQTSIKNILKRKDIGRHSILQEDQDSYTVTNPSNAAASYHVNMALGCCTCPAGLKGGHCKHQSAVARMFGHADSFLQCLSPESRKLYYEIATGNDLLEEGSRRCHTLVLKKPSECETDTQVCTSEIYCGSHTDADADIMHEPMEASLIQMQPSTPEETDSGELQLKERLNRMFLDMTKKLDNPVFTHSITSFVQTYENIKTDSVMVSALSSFGKPPQTRARGCKRPRGYRVQSTAASKRKTLDGENVLSSGQPSDGSREDCDSENTGENPNTAFHSIVHCVEETLCLVETQ